MKTCILTVASLVLVGFTFATVASANDKGPGSNKSGSVTPIKTISTSRVIHDHFGRNILNYGRDYRGFTSRCWFPHYRCYGYYCPADGLWFYWSAELGCYVPSSYMTTYPPTPAAAGAVSPPLFAAPNTVGQRGPSSLPPGATAAPVNTTENTPADSGTANTPALKTTPN